MVGKQSRELEKSLRNKKFIIQGAEAMIFSANMKTGDFEGEVVIKERKSKGYRNKILDKKINFGRIKAEVRIIRKLRPALRTPSIYFVDFEKNRIYMEKFSGKKLKDCFDGLSEKRRFRVAEIIGRKIGRMHSLGIVHGDLTLANMFLLRENGKLEIGFIDFGLSKESHKTEDMAVDLLVFKRTFLSTHLDEKSWKRILRGYLRKGRKEVVERMEKVEKRARYL